MAKGSSLARQTDERFREHFDWLVEQIAAGESVQDLFRQVRINADSFRKFLKRAPEFSGRYYWAMGQKPRQAGGGFRYAESQFSEALALFSSNIEFRSDHFRPAGLPSYNAMLKRSYRDSKFAAAWSACRRERITAKCSAGVSISGRRQSYSNASYEAFLDAVRCSNQRRLDEFIAVDRPGLPSWWAAEKRAKRDASFAMRFAEAVRAKGGWARGVSTGRPKPSKPVYQTAQLRGQLLQDSLYAAADKAVSHGLDPQARDDVMMDIIEAVLDGKLAFDEIAARAKQYVTAHFGRVSSRKCASLDQNIVDDGGVTFVDRLTTDDYSYTD